MLKWRRLATSVLNVLGLLAVLCTTGCRSTPTSGPEPQPELQAKAEELAYNPDGFNLAIVTDISGSMKKADPRGFNREGAQLAVSLASRDDNLALVAFNDDVEKVVPLSSMAELPAQQAFSTAIDTLTNTGGTNFIAALQESTRQLAYLKTTGQTAVIFLSDGKHTPVSEHPRVREIAEQGGEAQRRLFTIALGSDTDESLLQDMANVSGGNSYIARRADGLVDAYLKILGDFYNLFTYDADYRKITVDQSAKRLIYLLIKNESHPDASFDGAIQHNGKPTSPSAAVYRRPPSLEATFDVIQFDSELAGTWTCDVDPAIGQVILLSEVPISFRILPENPGAEYFEGDQVPYALEASCGTAELAQHTAATTTVAVQRWAGDASSQSFTLTGKQQGDLVIYSGMQPVAQLNKIDDVTPELQTARFEISLSDTGWTHTKETSLRVHPKDVPPTDPVQFSGEGLSGTSGSQSLSLGTFWAHNPVTFERSIQLDNTSRYSVSYDFSVAGGLVSAPQPVQLEPRTSATVTLAQAMDSPKAGRHTGALMVRGRFTEAQYASHPVTDTTIALDLAVHAVSLGTPKPLSVQPGFAGKVSFPVTMAVPGTVLSVTANQLVEGSVTGLTVTWPKTLSDELALTVAIPELTPAGRYEATFRPKLEGSGLNPAPAITVSFNVGGSKPTIDAQPPSTLTINSATAADSDGWVEFPGGIDVVMSHHGPLSLSAVMANLVNSENNDLRISKVDLRMVPKKVTLQPETHQQLALRVNVGNLPAAGTYQGMVTLRFREPGETDILETAELNISVVVEQN
ncbi:MAG: hypothetical protein ACI9EF_001000 [Pseudohongiellaceae bacterium]|jgi:hypothetical protein